jgi:hypothetical protein
MINPSYELADPASQLGVAYEQPSAGYGVSVPLPQVYDEPVGMEEAVYDVAAAAAVPQAEAVYDFGDFGNSTVVDEDMYEMASPDAPVVEGVYDVGSAGNGMPVEEGNYDLAANSAPNPEGAYQFAANGMPVEEGNYDLAANSAPNSEGAYQFAANSEEADYELADARANMASSLSSDFGGDEEADPVYDIGQEGINQQAVYDVGSADATAPGGRRGTMWAVPAPEAEYDLGTATLRRGASLEPSAGAEPLTSSPSSAPALLPRANAGAVTMTAHEQALALQRHATQLHQQLVVVFDGQAGLSRMPSNLSRAETTLLLCLDYSLSRKSGYCLRSDPTDATAVKLDAISSAGEIKHLVIRGGPGGYRMQGVNVPASVQSLPEALGCLEQFWRTSGSNYYAQRRLMTASGASAATGMDSYLPKDVTEERLPYHYAHGVLAVEQRRIDVVRNARGLVEADGVALLPAASNVLTALLLHYV